MYIYTYIYIYANIRALSSIVMGLGSWKTTFQMVAVRQAILKV